MDHSTTASLFDGREDGEEQLVPGGINKTYHCQRCLNHGRVVPRKGHKRCCMFADCSCYNCSLVEERKLLNRAINNVTEKASNWINVEDSEEFNEFQNSKNKIRHPKCARCAIHVPDSEPPPLKGHKRKCPYQDCVCRKCSLVSRRRSVMARQIHLRRIQRFNKRQIPTNSSSDRMNFSNESITNFLGDTFSHMFARPNNATKQQSLLQTPIDTASEEKVQKSIVVNPFPVSDESTANPFTTQNKETSSLDGQIFCGVKTLTLPLVPATSLPTVCGDVSNIFDILKQSSFSTETFHNNYSTLFNSALMNPFCAFSLNTAFFLCNNDLVS